MVMNETIKNAMEELEEWLSDPSELGKKPAKIEYTNAFTDEDGINCLIFKYKKNVFGKWLLGLQVNLELSAKWENIIRKLKLMMPKEYWKC